ncbi:MAG: sensor histidine kinase [Candidatus Sericytochromatia bacterium]
MGISKRSTCQITLVHTNTTLSRELADLLISRGYPPPHMYAELPGEQGSADVLLLEAAQMISSPAALSYWQGPVLTWHTEPGETSGPNQICWPGDEVEMLVSLEVARRLPPPLLERERPFQLLIQRFSDILVILGEDGLPRFISPSLEQISGYSAAEMMPHRPLDVVHPDDKARVLQCMKQCQDSPGKPVRFSYRHSHRSLGYIEVETVAQNLLHVPGIEGYVVVTRDISAHRAAMTQIAQSEQRYRIVAEQTGQMLYDWDLPSGHIHWAGAIEQITGSDPQSYQHVDITRWEALIHADDRAAAMQALDIASAGDGRYVIEYRLERSDGSFVWVEDNGIFLKNAAGEPERMLGSMKDISERRSASNQIEKALYERGILLQEIHHRVKNNFQVILSLLNLQLRKLQNPVASTHLIEARNRIRSMALVHDKLYEFSDVSAIDGADYLQQLTQELYTSFLPEIGGVQLIRRLHAVMLPVEQAIPCGLLVNELLTNAFKYAFPEDIPAEAWIEISLHAEGQQICLSVADNGCGLPPEICPESASSLGLQLLRGLVRQLNARFCLERTGGTRWELRFQRLQLPPLLKD